MKCSGADEDYVDPDQSEERRLDICSRHCALSRLFLSQKQVKVNLEGAFSLAREACAQNDYLFDRRVMACQRNWMWLCLECWQIGLDELITARDECASDHAGKCPARSRPAKTIKEGDVVCRARCRKFRNLLQ